MRTERVVSRTYFTPVSAPTPKNFLYRLGEALGAEDVAAFSEHETHRVTSCRQTLRKNMEPPF